MTDVRREEQLRIQAVGAAISRRDWHAVEQAYNAIRDEFDRRALAKPASSPAGGDVALVRAVKRAMENAGTLPAKEAVKLVPADWHRICDLVLGASQSTSAGRVGDGS